jgi:rubrerythrin
MKDRSSKAERISNDEQDIGLYMCPECFELLYSDGKCPKCGTIYKIKY